MWKEKYEALEADHKRLVEAHDALAARENARLKRDRAADGSVTGSEGNPTSAGASKPSFPVPDVSYLEATYDYMRRRAREDPGILELLIQKPELRVRVERPVVEANGNSLRGKLALLISEGFFDEPHTGSAAYSELANRRKFRTSKPNVYRECDALANMGFLVSGEAGYQAVPGMKVKILEAGN